MDLLSKLATIAACALLCGLVGVVMFKMADGTVSLAGLLETKGPAGPPSFSPARLQMLIATVVVAAQYLYAVITNPVPGSLPGLPSAALAVLGGSYAVYAGSKAIDTFIQPILKGLRKRGDLP
jgi:hypothetical protein